MPLRRLLVIVAGLYVIEGFPMGVFRVVLPAWWVEAGLSKASIGFASGFALAWSLKVLWSPLVQWRGDFRSWICGALPVAPARLCWCKELECERVSRYGRLWRVHLAQLRRKRYSTWSRSRVQHLRSRARAGRNPAS